MLKGSMTGVASASLSPNHSKLHKVKNSILADVQVSHLLCSHSATKTGHLCGAA